MVKSKFELYGTLDLVEKLSCVPYSSFHQLCKPIPRENPKTKTSKCANGLWSNARASLIKNIRHYENLRSISTNNIGQRYNGPEYQYR